MFYKQQMNNETQLESYFTHFDSVAYYCCLIFHKSLTVLLISRKSYFTKGPLLDFVIFNKVVFVA